MRSVPSTGASSPRVPITVSSPGLPRGSRSCLSDAIPRLDTMVTAPLLQSPLGAPFGPSSRGVAAQPICCPAFRHWGASIALPASGLLCPLLTSPGRSVTVSRHPVLADNREISQGKTQIVLHVDAGFIKHAPSADGGLRGHVPARPGRTTPHIRFLFVAPRILDWASSRPHLAMKPLPFSLPSAPRLPGTGTSTPLDLCHAWHTRSGSAAARQRRPLRLVVSGPTGTVWVHR